MSRPTLLRALGVACWAHQGQVLACGQPSALALLCARPNSPTLQAPPSEHHTALAGTPREPLGQIHDLHFPWRPEIASVHRKGLVSSASPPGGPAQAQVPRGSEAGEASSSSTSTSWWGKMKSMIWKDPGSGTTGDSTNDVATALESFAKQLDEARKFGQLAEFGRSLPRGGEGLVTASLKQQQDIARTLAGILPASSGSLSADGSLPLIASDVKAAAAARVGCTVVDVDNFLRKFAWFCHASKKMEELKAQGKPMPKSFAEVEEMVGSRWSRQGSPGTGAGSSPPSRNSVCPCGSGKKYKRCCGAGSVELKA